MAQAKGLIKIVKMKVGLVTSQGDELHGVLDKYVQQMTHEARETLETEEQDVNKLREISSAMDTVLEYLVNITTQIDNDTPRQIPQAKGLSSASSSSSSSLQQSSSGSRQRRSRDSAEFEEVSKLQHRIEVLESAFTACRNEMSQTTTQMTQAKDQLDTRCLRLEEKVQHLTNQNQEIERNQAVKFESMDKKIGDCQRQSQENDQRLANLENHIQKLDDVAKKVKDISKQVDKHERSVLPARVGFTASYPSGATRPLPSPGSRITHFTNVLCNEGNHYNPSTGEFICPIDGLYLVSATLCQWTDGTVYVNIKQSDNSTTSPRSRYVCAVSTGQTKTSSCGVAVVRLQKGDKVYVEVVIKEGDPSLYGYSSFSCLLIT